jgi:hypothetical protein
MRRGCSGLVVLCRDRFLAARRPISLAQSLAGLKMASANALLIMPPLQPCSSTGHQLPSPFFLRGPVTVKEATRRMSLYQSDTNSSSDAAYGVHLTIRPRSRTMWLGSRTTPAGGAATDHKARTELRYESAQFASHKPISAARAWATCT